MSASFTKAAEEVKSLKSSPTNDEKLKLYALYKIGTGEKFESASKPGMFDLAGKAKYAAWEKETKEGTTPEAAQTKYVSFVEELKTKYGF